MYKELILKLSQGNEWVKIQPPCPHSEIAYAEKVVGHPFPKALVDLLLEMNGDHWCLLSAQEIAQNAERNRETWLPLFEEDYTTEEYLDKVDRFIFFATTIATVLDPTESWTKPPSTFGSMRKLVRHVAGELWHPT